MSFLLTWKRNPRKEYQIKKKIQNPCQSVHNYVYLEGIRLLSVEDMKKKIHLVRLSGECHVLTRF